MAEKRINKTIVIDTNVLISAALTPGRKPAELIAKVLDNELTLVLCPAVILEYKEVFARPRFKQWKFPPEWFALLLKRARILNFDPSLEGMSGPDKDDFVFLSLAKREGAVLVTGNIKAYPMKYRNKVTVLTPAEYLASLL